MFIHYKRALHPVLAASYKTAGTLCGFSAALVAAIRLDPRCWICAAALLIYAAADYVLEFSFMLGAGLFLAGHICNISFFLNLVPVSLFHLVCLLMLAGFSLLVLWRWRRQAGKQAALFLLYGLSMIIMSVSAIGCFSSNTLSGILIACGGALFYVSDMFLLKRIFSPAVRAFDWIVMITYYSSVLLFGIACLNI